MSSLPMLWRHIESIPGGSTVLIEWRERLGRDLDLLKPFLVCTDELAASYFLPQEPYVEYRVCEHGDRGLVAIRSDTQRSVPLCKTDVLIYRLNHVRLVQATSLAIGFETAVEKVAGVPLTFRAGHYRPLAGFTFPVFFCFPIEPRNMVQALQQVASLNDDPFIFVTPTRRLLESATETLLKRRRACFLTLEETVEYLRTDKWRMNDSGKRLLAEFDNQVISQRSNKDGIILFPTPAHAKWNDLKIRFVDGHSVHVSVCGQERTLIYSQMGMIDNRNCKPNKQWELLCDLARSQGYMDWNNPAARQVNQKRKEHLVRDLKAFFRIDGDPIANENNGKAWKTVFQIKPDSVLEMG
jgi:hypothetical protein